MNTDDHPLAGLSEFKNEAEHIGALEKRVELLQQQLKELIDSDGDQSRIDRGAQALQLAEMIIDNSPAVLFRRKAAEQLKERKMVYVSPNISRYGYQAEDFLENRMMFRQIVYPGDIDMITEEIQEYVSRGIEGYSQTYRIVTNSGELRWVEDRTSVVEDELTGERYHQGIIVDVHERKEAEEKLRRSEEKYRRIVDTAGEGFLLMDENLCIVDLNTAFAKMVGKRKEDLFGTNPFAKGTGEYRKYLDDCQKKRTGLDYREFECEVSYQDKRVVPVLVHANTLRSDSGEVIGNMAFITDMTEHKKALELAGEVQRGLLPDQPPIVPGVEMAGRNVPCDEVGGDYFDFLWDESNGNKRLSIVVGDITGHGVDAALLMSSARAFLRMRASQTGSLIEIVTAMNQHLTTDLSESGRFMTMFYLALDRQSGQLEWIRAGHDPALIYDPEKDSFEELKGPGLALGVLEDFEYEPQYWNGLKPGQVIVIGTDGIWESCNPSGEMFGRERLMEIVRKTAAQDAPTILETVFQEHGDFSDGLKSDDDLTLVVVKIQPD
ncbi:MAG: SpoIIE family protein phosphatase [Desulfofustis sp.]|nr:SpoIIE family protein phosphatase [Desulfofustis sp.]